MTDHSMDRRARFRIAAALWNACGDVVSPRQVRELAASVYGLLDGEVDPLVVIKRELEAARVPEQHRPAVASLVLMTLTDYADHELAELSASR